MDEREGILYQFFQELIEYYRHGILQQEEAAKLKAEEKKWLEEVRCRFHGPDSAEYKLIAQLVGSMIDLSCMEQEHLYMQGVKDGIRLKKKLEKIEEGEA